MMLETFLKNIEIWSNTNKGVEHNAKYHNLVEYLKVNKNVKGLGKSAGNTYYQFKYGSYSNSDVGGSDIV